MIHLHQFRINLISLLRKRARASVSSNRIETMQVAQSTEQKMNLTKQDPQSASKHQAQSTKHKESVEMTNKQ